MQCTKALLIYPGVALRSRMLQGKKGTFIVLSKNDRYTHIGSTAASSSSTTLQKSTACKIGWSTVRYYRLGQRYYRPTKTGSIKTPRRYYRWTTCGKYRLIFPNTEGGAPLTGTGPVEGSSSTARLSRSGTTARMGGTTGGRKIAITFARKLWMRWNLNNQQGRIYYEFRGVIPLYMRNR
jgi:hypothetical protein